MLTRRQILVGSVFAGMTAGLGSRAAAAFSIETTPRYAAAAFALACKPLGNPISASASSGDHGALVSSAQATLKSEIARGVLAANAQEVVVCPICGCRFIVTANSAE
jgi:hypothetical protein